MEVVPDLIERLCKTHGIPHNVPSGDSLFASVTVTAFRDGRYFAVWLYVHRYGVCSFYIEEDYDSDDDGESYSLEYGLHLRTRPERTRGMSAFLTDLAARGVEYIRYRESRHWYSAIYNVLDELSTWRNRHYAARKIQRAWKRCVTDPEYTVCKNRLLREFAEL
jgi:hypothetical protein